MHIDKVKTNHGAVYLLIELFTIVVGTKMVFGWHWRRVTFAILHSKLLQKIFEVVFLRYEDAIPLLKNLKTIRQGIVPKSDMCLMWTCDQPCHQHNQHLRIQLDQTLRALDTIILVLGCKPNIEELASQLSDVIPLVPLGIEHTCKH